VYFQTSDPQAESISLLECPSDGPARTAYMYWNNLSHKAFAKGNYAAYASPFHVDLQMLYRGAFISGGQPMAAVEDGSANTLAIAEVLTIDRDDDWRGVWTAPWTGATLLAFDMHPKGLDPAHGHIDGEEYAALTNAPYVASPDSVGKTQSPNCQGPNRDTIRRCEEGGPLYHAAEAAHMPCMASKIKPGLTGHDSAAPRSLHPGGVNGAHLDGHVEFLANEIDDFLMAYRVSINDGATGN
jgi:prepilin-type processing-associated H-X9-DG protein